MKLEQVTETELSILQILWEHGEASSRAITEELYEEVTDPKLSSVQKLLERLESKGCVSRDRSRRAHQFSPLVSHEQFLRNRLQALADRLCDGAVAPLMSTLLRSRRVSAEQRRRLRELIGELWPEGDETLDEDHE